MGGGSSRGPALVVPSFILSSPWSRTGRTPRGSGSLVWCAGSRYVYIRPCSTASVRVAPPVVLGENDRTALEQWARGRSTPHRLILRARILLRAAEGQRSLDIARELHTQPNTVALCRQRYRLHGLHGVEADAPRPGRLPSLPVSALDLVLRKTLHERPPGATHWSTRTLAQATGLSASTVRRIWKSHRLQPHLIRSFKVSKDQHYVEKVHDVVGLYLNPPQHAVVLSVDEKTQIQALDRTQTILPLRPGLPETRTHDYRRNGHIDLFAALNTVSGTVVTEFHIRHRNREFRLFLDTLDRTVPEELEVHLILDNLSVHKHPSVKRWLRRHPRFHFHFVPTSSSFMNQVERWFKRLTDTRIRRGTFRSVPALKAAIDEFVATYNGDPRPFVWTATPEKIIGSWQRARARLNVEASGALH